MLLGSSRCSFECIFLDTMLVDVDLVANEINTKFATFT
jgi:hypothetical protein